MTMVHAVLAYKTHHPSFLNTAYLHARARAKAHAVLGLDTTLQVSERLYGNLS